MLSRVGTAFDNYDGDLTDKVIITGTVNTNVVGIYYITYEVADSSGNKKQIQRQIIVENIAEVPDSGIGGTGTANEIEEPPVSSVPKPVITSIIRSTNSARVAAIDEESEIEEYAITETAAEPETWTVVPATASFSRSITGLDSETDYYLWVKNLEGRNNI